MPLNASDLGSREVWPTRYVPAGQPYIPSVNGGRLAFLPTLIAKATFTDAPAIVTNGISVSHAGAGVAGTTNMTLGGSLASGGVATLSPARNVVITVTHGTSIVAMNGVITGKDLYGRVITEAWSVTATGTSKTYTSARAFSSVTQITEVIAATAAANTIIVGTGKVFALPFKAASSTIISELQDGAAPTAGVIVRGSSAANVSYLGTYTPNSAPNGALDFEVWYLCDDPVTVQP